MNRVTGVPAVLAIVTAAAVMVGCSESTTPQPPGPQTTTVVISYDELLAQKTVSRSVTLKVGDTLQVSLGSNPSTGYQWAPQMTIADDAVIAQTGHERITPSQNRPGAPANEVWALQAMGRGTTTVVTTYGQPWEGGEKNSWSFTAKVTVN